MSRFTEEEIQARAEARKAEREAKKAAKQAEATEASVARLRELEQKAKEANDKAKEARESELSTKAGRRVEVAEKQKDAKERRDEIIEDLHNFYEPSLDKTGTKLIIDLNNYKIVEKLIQLGFYRFDQPDGSSEFVHIEDNKIRLMREKKNIVDAFVKYVRALPDRDVTLQAGEGDLVFNVEKTIQGRLILEKMFKNIDYYFNSTLDRLLPREDTPIQEITTVHDTPDSKYFFFNNVVLRVTKNGIEEIEYADLSARMEELGEDNGKYIWESNILNRDYYKTNSVGEFQRFAYLICGQDSMPQEIATKRLHSLMSILGYLMHDSYECNLKAVVLTDATQVDGMATGGTGKGILGKALAHIINRDECDRKYIALPGKDFDTSKDTRYSLGDITTQAIHIEDAKKDLDLVALYNDITDGAVFRKLHHDPTYHRSKFLISTNTPISNVSESNKRRMCIFELDNYFNSRRTPEDVFGHLFFGSKWTEQDWLEFDNFMVMCAYAYMKNGLVELAELNYSENYLKQNLRNEFYEWIKDKLKIGIQLGTQNTYELNKLYNDFTDKYDDVYRVRNSFTKDLKLYLRVKKVPSCITRANPDLLVLYPNEGTTVSDLIYK